VNDTSKPLGAEAYLAAIVESSEDAILSKSTDGVIRSCNAAGERIFGYAADELIGRPVRVLIPPDRQAEEDDILERIARGERVQHFETVRVRKDGRLIDVSLTISPTLDTATGEVIGASKIARDVTEQKRAHEAEAYLAAIIESSTDAIIAKDLDGVIRSCNKSCERIFGYAAKELVGRPIYVLIPPERHTEEDEILARIRAGGRVEHFETVRLAKDGRRLDVSLSVSPIRDQAGRIVGIAKVARDITAQKRAARELAEQQEWFRVTLASIGDAVIASGPDGRVTYMNRPAEALTGWRIEEAEGRPLTEVFDIINEETREPVRNPAARVMSSGHVVALANHTVLIDRHGTERPIADSAAPIRDAAGNVIGVVLVFRDVTEERRAEEAIAEQREWFERTLESIGDGVIATDVRGLVVFMNPVAEHLTGWKLDDALGRPCTEVFDIVNEDTRRTVENPVKRVLDEGVIVGLANHTILIAADGTERPIDDSGAPIRNRSGRIVGAVLVFRDITDRRRAEEERRFANAERERLLEAERAARAEAERASRVKDEFVAMVSHELRTPLNAILGWTQLMMQKGADAEVMRRGLDVISRNTRLQAQLIADLLDMSRIVSGKLRLEIQEAELAPLIRNAIDAVQHAAANKRLELVAELEPARAVAGDPARLQQIFWNLLWNAIKFTPEGGTVRVRMRDLGAEAEITVEDTGVGIRPELLPHIFDRFQQGNAAITRRFGGLGLGLSIVKHLVDLHGGRITAESEGEGKGARFTVVLPCGTAQAATPFAVGDAPIDPALQAPDLLDRLRILLVEDEQDTLDFLERFLESHGATVIAARGAAEALAMLPAAAVDFLVSDIGLPETDGYELLRRIRAGDFGAASSAPAIALTAYARPEDRLRSFRAGYQAHLTKPVDPTELVATIANLAKLSAPRDEAS